MSKPPSFFQQKTSSTKPCSLLTRALNHNESSSEESGSERLPPMSVNDPGLLELQNLLKTASCSKSRNPCPTSSFSRPANPLPCDARWVSIAPFAANLSLQTLNDTNNNNNNNNVHFSTTTTTPSSSYDTRQPHLSTAGSAPAFNFKSTTTTRGRCSPVQSWPMNPSYPERLRSV